MLEYSWGKVVAANLSICRVTWHFGVVLTYLGIYIGELYNIKQQPNSKKNSDVTMTQTFWQTAELRPFL